MDNGGTVGGIGWVMGEFVGRSGNIRFLGRVGGGGDCAEGLPLTFYSGGGCVAVGFWDGLIGNYEKSKFRLAPLSRVMLCVGWAGGGRREM